MKHLINVQRFHEPLATAGLVPANCRVIDLSIGVSGALAVKYEVFLTAEQLITLGEIFRAVGQRIVDEDTTPPPEIA